MTASAMRAAVKTRLQAGFTSYPIAFANEPFGEPMDAVGNPLPWVFFDPDTVDISRYGVGPVYKEHGLFQVHVFYPVYRGEDGADAIRASITTLFAGATFAGFRSEVVGDYANTGADPKSNYAASTLTIEVTNW